LALPVTISVVLYKPHKEEIEKLFASIAAIKLPYKLYVIDNSPVNDFEIQNKEWLQQHNSEYIFTGKNYGFGRAHNIALRRAMNESEYHLVINPDIYFDEGIIEKIYDYASRNTDVAQLMPKVLYPNGQLQYTCKLIPSPVDLLIRLLPKNFFRKRRENFELRFTGYNKEMNIPYLSGCFMFFRCEALRQIGLFDERFFLYPEDIDITRRMHREYKTIFFPSAFIYHAHAKASFKNMRLFFVHAQNIARYFNKWGWFFDGERKKINTAVLKALSA
jgi:GT2 family glycosyltransferase